MASDLQKKHDKLIKQIEGLSDQSHNATETINLLLVMLDNTEDEKEKDVIKNTIQRLYNIPSYEILEKKKVEKQIENINQNIEDKKKDVEDVDEAINNIKEILQIAQILDKKLEKIKFNETQGFLWKGDNISNLENLSDNIVKAHGKHINYYSQDEKSNKDVLRLYNELNNFVSGKKISRFKQFGDSFGYNLHHFYQLYMKSVQVLKTLNKDYEIILKGREEKSKYATQLNDPNLAKRLNAFIAELRELIKQILASEEQLIKELEIIKNSNLQIVDSLEKDKLFMGSLINPGLINKLMKREVKQIVNDSYYVEAKTSKIFFKHTIKIDPTGVLNREESYDRLYKQVPIFDNDRIYSMNDDIRKLMSEYFQAGDKLIDDFPGYLEELYEMVKRVPKLDPKVKGVLLIPSYLEERSIVDTLKNYSSCNNFEDIVIVLLENLVVGKKRDSTLAKVQLFKMNHPNVKVYHVFKSFSKKVPIGFIRKYLTEFALALKYNSGHPGNLIMVGGDADCIKIEKNFFSGIINAFESNPYLDAVQMKMDFPMEYMMAYPNLWVMHRVFDFSWQYMRRKVSATKEIRMYGPASAIKASSYLMIKGYNPGTTLCEDLQLSWLLDEARRYNTSEQQDVKDKKLLGGEKLLEEAKLIKIPKDAFFTYLNSSAIVTNPRRGISSYLSNVNLLDSYEDFYEKDSIRNAGWEELIDDEKNKGILNVGNYNDKKKKVMTSLEIREAIDEAKKNKFQHDMAKTLAYGLQRYIDWWQRKVDPRYYKNIFKPEDIENLKDEEIPKWMSYPQFLDMLKRVMGWIGIEYQLERSNPHWTFRVLNVAKLELNMNEKMKENGKKVVVINVKNLSREEVKRGESKLIIVGHDYGGVGDVTRARKVNDLCMQNNIPVYLLDLYTDLLPGLSNKYIDKYFQGKIVKDPENNEYTKVPYSNVVKLKKKELDSVIFSGTWLGRQYALINLGLTQMFPSIASCGTKNPKDFHKENISHDFIGQLNQFSLIYALYPVSAQILRNYNVPEHKIVLLQYIFPKGNNEIYKETLSKRYYEDKINYMKGVAAKMGKEINPNKNSILIGPLSRIVEFYKNSEILESLIPICQNNKNVYLLFKSKRIKDNSADVKFYALLEKYKNEPWLLYDEERSGMPRIFEIYSYLDLGIYANEIGNAAAEMSSVGVPLLVSNGVTNRSLLTGFAEFFKLDDYNELAWKVSQFVSSSKHQRHKLRKHSRKMAEQRFSPDDYLKKLKLAMQAARVYYAQNNDNADPAVYDATKKLVEKQFVKDIALFHGSTWELKESDFTGVPEKISGKKRIIWVIDTKGKAFDIEASRMKNKLSSKYKIQIILNSRNLVDKLKKLKPDLVHFANWMVARSSKFGENYEKYKGIGCKYSVGVRSGVWLLDQRKNDLIKYLKTFDGVSVINHYFLTFLPDVKNAMYVPNGVDGQQFTSTRTEMGEPLLVGWVGNVKRGEKRYDTLFLPAMKLVKDVAIFKKTRGFIATEKMPEYYNSVDIVVISSNLVEGGPLVLSEAAACGRTLVCTRIGLIPEFIEGKKSLKKETGFTVYENMVVIDDDTPQTLANAIRYLHDNKSLIPKLGEEGRKTFEERFDDSIIATYNEKLFTRLLEKS